MPSRYERNLIHGLNLSGASVQEVGGKGLSLIRLTDGGFPVPAGFVVTAAAYDLFLEQNRLRSVINDALRSVQPRDIPSARTAASTIQQAFDGATLPEASIDAVSTAYSELVGNAAGAVAVRSSAVSEDGAHASSAGLYTSYLNVRGLPGTLQAVRDCYRSLWSARAVQYRALRGQDNAEDLMAVVVMGFVPSRVAGVAFTANPVSGSRDELVINASYGLGEAVVSGAVTPDTFIVRKGDLAILGREIAEKQFRIEASPDNSGVTQTPLGPEGLVPSLTDGEIEQLASTCRAVETLMRWPTDIEWGLDGSALTLFQARPITTLT